MNAWEYWSIEASKWMIRAYKWMKNDGFHLQSPEGIEQLRE